jgi:gamma-glutamylaminecyclotransferase
MQLIFLFGTLKEGYPNCHSNFGKRVEGDFLTIERYPLYLVGERYSPWLINDPGTGEFVQGQVFSVDQDALDIMDSLERVTEPDGYQRVEIIVKNCKTVKESVVHIYMKQPHLLDPGEIKLGPLKCYELEHSSLYASRYA